MPTAYKHPAAFGDHPSSLHKRTSPMRTPLSLATAASALLLTAGLLAPAGAAHAQAMSQNFDALACTDADPYLSLSNEGGLTWSNFLCLKTDTYPYVSGYQPGTTSGTNVAFAYPGSTATLSRSGDNVFSLVNAQVTAAWSDGMTLTIRGFLDSTPVATITLTPLTSAPILVDLSAMHNVNRVEFSRSGGTQHSGWSGNGNQIVIDDLNYILGPAHTVTVSPVPANGTLSCSPNPVPDGANATCTATPDAGYTVASFTGCTQVGTGNTCTLTNVTAPATVSATFVAAPVVAVPTLNEWALMLLGLGAAGLGARRLRRRGPADLGG